MPTEIGHHLEIGYDCLKVYERLEPGVLGALVEGAHEHGLRVVERDVRYTVRTAGESKVSGSIRGSARAARDFLVVLR